MSQIFYHLTRGSLPVFLSQPRRDLFRPDPNPRLSSKNFFTLPGGTVRPTAIDVCDFLLGTTRIVFDLDKCPRNLVPRVTKAGNSCAQHTRSQYL